eukprot:gnl/MRDRNA2_/MRDRNA2_14419_c0_seq1.p1 gnl/MRDRNA2_/MRDRNA2_14419_c0~~gnl/MRDRNA2_/MRDRNA2_14419_c0_seq1.p1  ORF type:complete len:146 (+),score=38.81 gnl/MRDRNA2_/MRDRNA2_14419_c0_seq1:42-440(+)
MSAPEEACQHQLSEKGAPLEKDDPVLKYYKKEGLFGAITGAFGDKKTMYCHHITKDGKYATKEAGDQKFKSQDEVWQFLGKCCQGRYAYDRSKGALVCGTLVKGDHDNTCNAETCLFIKNGLECPTPKWAFK